jgi:hypothetical protein
MNTAIDVAKGLTLIATSSPSAVSNITINNCFSSTYQNYLVLTNLIGSGDYQGHIYLTSGGTPSTSSYGRNSVYSNNSGGPSRYWSSSDGSFAFGYIAGTKHVGTTNIYSPFESSSPSAFTSHVWSSGNATVSQLDLSGSTHNVSASYDGIKIAIASGTMTGTIKVYGYKNS